MPAPPVPGPLPPLQHLDDGCLSARLRALEARRSAQEAEVEALRWVAGWRQERSYLKACRVLSWQDVAQAYLLFCCCPMTALQQQESGWHVGSWCLASLFPCPCWQLCLGRHSL